MALFPWMHREHKPIMYKLRSGNGKMCGLANPNNRTKVLRHADMSKLTVQCYPQENSQS